MLPMKYGMMIIRWNGYIPIVVDTPKKSDIRLGRCHMRHEA
jgi:hypothetical protein